MTLSTKPKVTSEHCRVWPQNNNKIFFFVILVLCQNAHADSTDGTDHLLRYMFGCITYKPTCQSPTTVLTHRLTF